LRNLHDVTYQKTRNRNMAAVIIGAVFVAVAATTGGTYVWSNTAYERVANATMIPADTYMTDKPSFMERIQSILLNRYVLSKSVQSEPYRIVAEDHPQIQGLKQTRMARAGEVNTKSVKVKAPLIIGTIRMGFGHYRIAYAVASYATDVEDHDVIFHDIVPFGEEGALVD
jgi:hypothetical protein